MGSRQNPAFENKNEKFFLLEYSFFPVFLFFYIYQIISNIDLTWSIVASPAQKLVT